MVFKAVKCSDNKGRKGKSYLWSKWY